MRAEWTDAEAFGKEGRGENGGAVREAEAAGAGLWVATGQGKH